MIKPISWKKFDKFLKYVGCTLKCEKGDHMIYWRDGLNRPIVIPKVEDIPTFVVRNNLRTLGIPKEEYLEILERV
ncbi:MAG: type II toxin-antitoxin system HicA family toxin [Candidatus Aenigmarchaeota archaeon]|nr:type II toxin-antitoxin system HicA family toxin [Candidatus Aenigmarchaeota archaeon]